MFAGPGVLQRLTLGASGEPAREVLAKVLARFDSKVSWRLFYDFPLGAYALNLAPVSTEYSVRAVYAVP